MFGGRPSDRAKLWAYVQKKAAVPDRLAIGDGEGTATEAEAEGGDESACQSSSLESVIVELKLEIAELRSSLDASNQLRLDEATGRAAAEAERGHLSSEVERLASRAREKTEVITHLRKNAQQCALERATLRCHAERLAEERDRERRKAGAMQLQRDLAKQEMHRIERQLREVKRDRRDLSEECRRLRQALQSAALGHGDDESVPYTKSESAALSFQVSQRLDMEKGAGSDSSVGLDPSRRKKGERRPLPRAHIPHLYNLSKKRGFWAHVRRGISNHSNEANDATENSVQDIFDPSEDEAEAENDTHSTAPTDEQDTGDEKLVGVGLDGLSRGGNGSDNTRRQGNCSGDERKTSSTDIVGGVNPIQIERGGVGEPAKECPLDNLGDEADEELEESELGGWYFGPLENTSDDSVGSLPADQGFYPWESGQRGDVGSCASEPKGPVYKNEKAGIFHTLSLPTLGDSSLGNLLQSSRWKNNLPSFDFSSSSRRHSGIAGSKENETN